MTKKIFSVILCVILCLGCVGFSASAAQIDTSIQPMSIPLILVYDADLNISGSTAYITASMSCTSSTTGCAINAQLQRSLKDSDSWSTAYTSKTSANSNSCSLSDSTSVNTSTYKYRLYVTFSAVKSTLGSDYYSMYAY